MLEALIIASALLTTPCAGAASERTPHAAADTPTLDLLSPAQRKMVEEEATHCVRFSDGTLWTNHPEAVLKKFREIAEEKRSEPVIPLPAWFCPATRETACSKDEIYDRIDRERARAVIEKEHLRLWDGRVSQVLKDGLLVRLEGDVAPMYRTIYVTGFPLQDKVVDEQSIGLTVREKGKFQAGGRTVKWFEWFEVKNVHVPRTLTPVSAEELAFAAYTGEISKGLVRWVIVPTIVKPAGSIPASFTGSEQYGHTSPPLYQNAVHGWKIDQSTERLDFDYVNRKTPTSVPAPSPALAQPRK